MDQNLDRGDAVARQFETLEGREGNAGDGSREGLLVVGLCVEAALPRLRMVILASRMEGNTV
jgi:hypothetical protein